MSAVPVSNLLIVCSYRWLHVGTTSGVVKCLFLSHARSSNKPVNRRADAPRYLQLICKFFPRPNLNIMSRVLILKKGRLSGGGFPIVIWDQWDQMNKKNALSLNNEKYCNKNIIRLFCFLLFCVY